MRLRRREFLHTAALGAGAATIGCAERGSTGAALSESEVHTAELPAAIRALKPMTSGVTPISDDERRGRSAKAQRRMNEQKLDAIFMEGTTSMFYFANMRW